MDIGLPAAIIIAGFTFAAAAMLLLLSWFQRRDLTALGIWGFAFAVGAVAVALIGARGHIPDVLSIIFANTLLAIAYGMMWNGARLFEKRQALVVESMLGALVWLIAMLVPSLYGWPVARASIMMTIAISYTLLTAWELWRSRGDNLHSRWPAIALLLMHAAALPTRVPLVGEWAAGTHPAHTNLILFVMFESIPLAVAGAYLFGSLVRERIAVLYEHAASIDPLTGVANRRAFLHQGGRLVQRAATEGRQVSLLLFDLDHFKSINDEYGHAAGDCVLKSFCSVATAQLRPADLFGRIGGEEFACVLVDVGAKDAAFIAERVRFAFEGTTHHNGEHSFGATVSAGLAVSAEQFSDLPSLMVIADRALYRAKKNGRNLVVEEESADRSPIVLSSRSA
jgi:diguanylate cyclase (GGDEF)-like protein